MFLSKPICVGKVPAMLFQLRLKLATSPLLQDTPFHDPDPDPVHGSIPSIHLLLYFQPAPPVEEYSAESAVYAAGGLVGAGESAADGTEVGTEVGTGVTCTDGTGVAVGA